MKIITLTALALLCFATASHAVDEHKGNAHEAKARHSGVVSVVQDMHYELVAKEGEVALYVSDHGKPQNLAGATAALTLLSGTQKQQLDLAPVDNALRAKGKFTVPAGTKAMVWVQLKDQPKTSAKFTLP